MKCLRYQVIFFNNKYLIQPKVRTTRYGLNSFRYDGARIWHKLHNDFKVDDYYDFKRLQKNEITDYLAPHRGRARYCNAHVCLFVCVFVRVFAKFQSVISQSFLNRSS